MSRSSEYRRWQRGGEINLIDAAVATGRIDRRQVAPLRSLGARCRPGSNRGPLRRAGAGEQRLRPADAKGGIEALAFAACVG